MSVAPALPVLPTIRKHPPIACWGCAGEVTFGELFYEGERWVIPLAWHSKPHCSSYRTAPCSTDGVVDFARQCANAALRERTERS